MTNNVHIPVKNFSLPGLLTIPTKAKGLILFSHGSGSSRHSTRNLEVAQYLNENNFATLLFDLLSEEEDKYYENRFDMDLLSSRLIIVTQWIKNNELSHKLPLGYFGASTGAASALIAAAYFGKEIKAIVSRGGRPDMALLKLNLVVSPTLLLIGSIDAHIIDLNRFAYNKLTCSKEMRIIPGASHLFQEEGKLQEISAITCAWFNRFIHSTG